MQSPDRGHDLRTPFSSIGRSCWIAWILPDFCRPAIVEASAQQGSSPAQTAGTPIPLPSRCAALTRTLAASAVPGIDEAFDGAVTMPADSAVNIRMCKKMRPGQPFGPRRAYNLLVNRHRDATGVEISCPALPRFAVRTSAARHRWHIDWRSKMNHPDPGFPEALRSWP